MVSETGPDPDQEPELFALFRKAWIEAEGDEFAHNMTRQSLRASAPKFADRIQMEKEEAMLAVRDTLPPEGLCGAVYEPPIPAGGRASRANWESCVFLPLHEGKHSWQR